MGHLGQQYYTPGMAGHCLVTLVDPTHPTMNAIDVAVTVLNGSNCHLGTVCPSMMCMPSSTAWAAMGH